MATLDQTAAFYDRKREKALRAALCAEFGARKYRIVSKRRVRCEVHVHGRIPNSTVSAIGWYVLGNYDAVASERVP